MCCEEETDHLVIHSILFLNGLLNAICLTVFASVLINTVTPWRFLFPFECSEMFIVLIFNGSFTGYEIIGLSFLLLVTVQYSAAFFQRGPRAGEIGGQPEFYLNAFFFFCKFSKFNRIYLTN